MNISHHSHVTMVNTQNCSNKMDNKLTFHEACLEGDVKKRVSYLLRSQHISLEFLHEGLLHESEEGHTQIVKILLDHGATLDWHNSDEEIAVSLKKGHFETVKGWSVLLAATYHGHTETVKLLLHYNAQVDDKET